MQRPQRRELARQPLDLELVEPDRLQHVLQPLRPQITQRHPVEQRGGRLRDKHLATVPGRHDPRRPMHIHPHVLRRHRQRLPGMHTHPHPQPTLVRPLHRRQALLRLTRGRDRLTRSLERNQEGIALFVDLIAAMPRERLTQHPPMQRKHLREPLRTQPLQQQRRPLHIREQQRHRPRRLHHHQATIARAEARHQRGHRFAPRSQSEHGRAGGDGLPRAVGQTLGTPRRGAASACVSGRRSLERGESFAGAAGERDDLLAFVESECFPLGGEGFVVRPAASSTWARSESASACVQGESVVLGVRDRLAGEPLGFGVVAAVRGDERCDLRARAPA